MTREEAITNLNMIRVAFVDPVTKEQMKLINNTFDTAIKALEQEPKTVSWMDLTYYMEKTHTVLITREALDELKERAAVRNTGHWIAHPNCIFAHLVCDQCLSRAPYDCKTNYCPNCGARMERKDTE